MTTPTPVTSAARADEALLAGAGLGPVFLYPPSSIHPKWEIVLDRAEGGHVAFFDEEPVARAVLALLNDAPALLASSRALEAENARLRAALESMTCWCHKKGGVREEAVIGRDSPWGAEIEARPARYWEDDFTCRRCQALGAARGEDKAKGGA